jgi:hypothetical protein
VEAEQVLVRKGYPTIARAQAVSPLRQAADDEQRLQMEIAERTAQLEAAREAGVAIQDEFDTAVAYRVQERKSLAFYNASLAGSQARLLELQSWIESNFRDSPTVEQFAEHYRHAMMVQWLPGLIEKSKSRLAALDAEISKLARENDLTPPE